MNRFLSLFFVVLLHVVASQRSCVELTSCSLCTAGSDCAGGRCTWCIQDNNCVPYLLNFCPLNARVDVAYNCPRTMPDNVDFDDAFVRTNVTSLLCAANLGSVDAVQTGLQTGFPGLKVSNYYSKQCLIKNSTGLFGLNFLNLGPVLTPNYTCSGYVAVDSQMETIFVVFSTTVDPLTAVAQIGNIFALPSLVNTSTDTGRAYDVFNNAFNDLWTGGLASDYSSALGAVPTFKTVVLGYSIGGATASIAADVIAKRFLGSVGGLELYTFGQPRVGDMNYAMNHDQLVPLSYRVINRLDPVPLSPPKDFNLDPAYHHRFEVWYQGGTQTPNYTLFQLAEDPRGRVSNIFTDPNDGITYFGKNMLTCRP